MADLNKILRYVIIAGVFGVLLVPIVVANANFFPFITGKAYMLRILVEIISAAWLVLIVLDPSYRPKKTAITISVVVLALVSLLSNIFGMNAERSIWSNYERMEGWIMIAHLCLYFCIATSVMKGRKIWNYWLGFSLGVSLVIAGWGIFQINCANMKAGNNGLIKDTKFCTDLSKGSLARFFGGLQIMQGDRLNSTLGNAGYYGVYTMIHVFIAALLLARALALKWSPTSKSLIIVSGVLNLVALYYTATRGSMIGLIVGTILVCAAYSFFVLINSSKDNNSDSGAEMPKSFYVSIGIILLIIFTVLIIWLSRRSDFVQSSSFLSRYANISLSDTKSQARAYIWPMAIKGFAEKPILGWGQENFNYVFDKYYDPRMWAQEQWFDRAHNVFLDWLVAGGILGFLAYLALYALPLWYVFRKSRLPYIERSILIGLLIAYGIHNIFIFDNISSYILFFGLLAYLNEEWSSENNQSDLLKKPVSGENFNNAVYVITPIALLLLIISLYTLNIKSLNANQLLSNAIGNCGRTGVGGFSAALDIGDPTGTVQTREQLWICTLNLLQTPGVPEEAKQQAFTKSMTEVNNQINENQTDARMYFFTASLLSVAGNDKEALLAYKKAGELSPNKPVFILGQANLLSHFGKDEEASTLFEQALKLSGDNPTVKSNYVLYLIRSNKISEAINIINPSADLKLSTPIITALYEKKAFKELIPIMQYRIENDPKNIKNYLSLAAIYLEPSINDRASARKIILKIKEIDPSNVGQVNDLITKYGL